MVGIDVRCPWTGAKAVNWNKRNVVSPLLTQGCTLQELCLPVLSIVHLVDEFYVSASGIYKKNQKLIEVTPPC